MITVVNITQLFFDVYACDRIWLGLVVAPSHYDASFKADERFGDDGWDHVELSLTQPNVLNR